jgi:hypothetical protein
VRAAVQVEAVVAFFEHGEGVVLSDLGHIN